MVTLSTTLQAALDAGAPQRVLLEFLDDEGAVAETMSNEEISISSGVRLSSDFNPEKELTLGSVASAEIQFSLLNDVRQLSNFAFGECKVWIGCRLADGVTPAGTKYATFTGDGLYEFAPLGIFVVERPDIVDKDVIQISANDRMVKFDEEMPSMTDLGFTTSQVSAGITIADLLSALCTAAGVTLATSTFLNSDLTFNKWPSRYFESRTMREVLRWIAEAAGSIARFNRDGELEMAWFTAVNVTFTESQHAEFVPTWYETAVIDELKVRNQGETSEHSYTPTGVTDPENAYVIAGNPFLS